MESEKLKNEAFSWQKLRNSFPLNQSKSGPDPKFLKHFTVRIQSKINWIRNSPDTVQSKSSPMLISGMKASAKSVGNVEDEVREWIGDPDFGL